MKRKLITVIVEQYCQEVGYLYRVNQQMAALQAQYEQEKANAPQADSQ